MFGLFKKKKSDHGSDVALLKQIFKELGNNFTNFQNQLDAGLIVGSKKRDKPVPGYTSFAYDINVLNKYEDKHGRTLAIRGIRVFDKQANAYVELQINVAYGIVLGFFSKGNMLVNPALDNIKVDGYTIHNTEVKNFDSVKGLLSKEDLRLINASDIYEINLKGKTYYHLVDIEDGDGDFIGVDGEKKIYRITHDPFTILALNGSLSDILRK